MLPLQQQNPVAGIEIVQCAPPLGKQSPELGYRPAYGVSATDRMAINNAAVDFIEALAAHHEFAHTHPLLSLCPDSAEKRMRSESEYSGKALINMHLVNGRPSVTEIVPA